MRRLFIFWKKKKKSEAKKGRKWVALQCVSDRKVGKRIHVLEILRV